MTSGSEKLNIPTEFPEDFVPSPEGGLSEGEARARQEQGLGNRSKADAGKSVGQILLKNLFTFFNMLNLALAACLMLVGSYKNMLFMGVVVSNTLISTVQEIRAKRTINKLKIASEDKVETIRGGKSVWLSPEELVKGDLVHLMRGSQAPADAIVLSGGASLNEALLTGESVPIPKQKDDWVLSGSFVTEGSLICQLVHVGDESYVNRLTKDARKLKTAKSQLMSDLNRLLRYLTFRLVPLGLLLFAKEYFLSHQALNKAVPDAVAAMIGMIPEGLMLLTSVALAVGVVRLGKKGALVQELYGIETLARADVLCLDKTGTLTTGELSVQKIIPVDCELEAAKGQLSRYLGAFQEENSGTVAALKDLIPCGKEAPTGKLSFSSERKKSAACFGDGTVLILGAPSFVLGPAYGGSPRQLCEENAAAGNRVLILCQARGSIGPMGELPGVERTLCVIVLQDAIRPAAAETLQWFDAQGVTIKIISGDDPITVSAIGRRLELKEHEKYIDISSLASDGEVADAAEKYTVFGRVSPERKRVLVSALKGAGHHVAMTGDGVNDIPALRAADCSICMAGGTEAAKHASQLTLVASDFTALPAIVAEGRRAVNNVTRAASLFLVKTLYSFLLSLVTLFALNSYPFKPLQLTLISSFTVGIPSFFLSLESNKERIRGDFIRTIVTAALPSALAVTLTALTAMLVKDTPELGSTVATLTAAFIGIVTLVKLCLPLNRYRGTIIAAVSAVLVVDVLFFGKVFYITDLSASTLLTAALLSAAGIAVMLATAYAMKKRRK
ncbi:MAG: HAD-IC family P-type ATPase [Clostridia bacterium]|nr:HAD-IC family P-type ATPase [Clostridia bacterium]